MNDIANIKVIYGAPCSGKSTYVEEVICDNDIRFDYDLIIQAVSNKESHEYSDIHLPYVVEYRNLIIQLSYSDTSINDTYIIATKITDKLLKELDGLNVEYKLIDRTKEECFENLELDASRPDKEFWKKKINKWFEWYEKYKQQEESLGGENMRTRFYSMYQNTKSKTADIYIYGDITSWPWFDGDVSSYTLSKELQELGDVEEINVYINSYGGEVGEGLAIYNALKRHKAKINTYSDGFACSIASVIFMAGDNRYMSSTSLLMIHNAWKSTWGNAAQLRKEANDLEIITQTSINAYLEKVNITEEEVKELLDKETWLSPEAALEKGFITEILEETKDDKPTQSIKETIIEKIQHQGKTETPIMNVDASMIAEMVANKLEEKYKLEEMINQKAKEKIKEPDLENFLMRAFFNEKK